MPFRFRKSIKLFPSVRVNVGNRGIRGFVLKPSKR